MAILLTLNHVDSFLKHRMTDVCPQSIASQYARKLIYHCLLANGVLIVFPGKTRNASYTGNTIIYFFSDCVCLSFIVNIPFCDHLIDIHLYKFFTCLGVNKICLNHTRKVEIQF